MYWQYVEVAVEEVVESYFDDVKVVVVFAVMRHSL